MKQIKYKNVMIVLAGITVLILVLILCFSIHDDNYHGNVNTYVASYRENGKVYTFDVKGFHDGNDMYLSLNDMYNMIVILDKRAKVYIHVDNHTMVYEMYDEKYYFDYGHHKIICPYGVYYFNRNNKHIYVSDKNIYIPVCYIEKILLQDTRRINIENANVIIE